MTAFEDLLDDIFDGQKTALYAEFERWLRHSRRFRAFAARNHKSDLTPGNQLIFDGLAICLIRMRVVILSG